MIRDLSLSTTRLRRLIGIDGSVGFTALARICSIVSSAGNVLLLVRFMNSIEQGYYYTILSLALLQTVFELGFSFVIQQFAAHESIHCTFSKDGNVAGDVRSHARLASVLRLALGWYLCAAIGIALMLLPTGFVFFSGKAHGIGGIAWQRPWIAMVLASAVSFLVAPIYSFLDGCGQVREVARARFGQAAMVMVMSWATMAAGFGLYAPAMVNLGVIMVGIVFLWGRRQFLFGMLRFRVPAHSVSWLHEIWPFQWKLAVSWLCTYFIAQLFTPILFRVSGPIEAGQMGMSLNIVSYLPLLVLSWISTKATPFGQLIRLGHLDDLDRLFFRTFRQSLIILIVMVAACLVAITGLPYLLPTISSRIASPSVFIMLLITVVCTFSVQSMAIYLRSFKEEPFLLPSVATSLLTAISIALTAKRWGAVGVAASYMISSGFLGLATAIPIFKSKRRERRASVLSPNARA